MEKMIAIWTVILGMLLTTGCKGVGGANEKAAGDSNGASTIHIFGDNLSTKQNLSYYWVDDLEANSDKPVVNHSVYRAMNTHNNYLPYKASGKLNQIDSNDIVILFGGTEDVRWYGVGFPDDIVDGFLSEAIVGALEAGAQVYVVLPPKMNPTVYAQFAPFNQGSDLGFSTYKQKVIDRINYIDISNQVHIVDVHAVFVPIIPNLQGDRQYPNENGQAVISSAILAEMQTNGDL